MSLSWQQRLTARQQQRQQQGLWRQRPLLTSAADREVQVNGRWLLNFASNDYLGLANQPALPQLAQQLHQQAGMAGSTASHVLAGHYLPHHLLEDELADWLGVERCVLFSSGYLANLAVQTAFLSESDCLFHDKLNHASLLDGARLSQAQFQRYPHLDMAALARRLAQDCAGLRMLVTDAVFSMDGDCVDLTQLLPLVNPQTDLLVIDEAHSFGVMGEQGQGVFSAQQHQAGDAVLRVGTLGKAFASSGAFIAGSALHIDTIMQFARSYIYTTAQPPIQASMSRASLRLVAGEMGDMAREKLQQLITHLQQGLARLGLNQIPSQTAIQPILLGTNARAVAWQQQLWQSGLWVPAIRPPTVPVNQARLRVSLSAAHQMSDIDRLLAALEACLATERG